MDGKCKHGMVAWDDIKQANVCLGCGALNPTHKENKTLADRIKHVFNA